LEGLTAKIAKDAKKTHRNAPPVGMIVSSSTVLPSAVWGFVSSEGISKS